MMSEPIKFEVSQPKHKEAGWDVPENKYMLKVCMCTVGEVLSTVIRYATEVEVEDEASRNDIIDSMIEEAKVSGAEKYLRLQEPEVPEITKPILISPKTPVYSHQIDSKTGKITEVK